MSSPLADYSSLFYLSPFPKWVYDLTTYEILDVNQAAIDHYGYSREEFLDLTIKDLRPKEEIPVVLAAHANISQQEGNIYFGIFTHQKKSGELIRMKIYGHKVDFLDKKCMVVVCQDVTMEERQVQDLKESEERLKAASSIAKLGYWRLKLDANTLTWSDEVFEIWGRDRFSFDVNFKNFFETIHPDDRKKFELEQNASFAGEKDHDIVHRILLPDNSIKWVHELGRLIKDQNGVPIYFEGTVQDVTQQKLEEQRLRLLESVITNTTDAILITEAEPLNEPGPRIVYVNEAFTKMTGYTAEEVIGKTPRILQGPKSDKEELAKLSKALRNWEPYEITTLNYKKNGEEFWINFTVAPVANENGWFTHWIAIERDVTDKKNQELEQKLLSKISLIFSEEKKLADAARKVCTEFAEFGEFDFVEVWTPNLENTQIQLLSHSNHSPHAEDFYDQTSTVKSFEFGKGLPGLVWKSKQALLLNSAENSQMVPRIEAALHAGLKSFLGLPLLFNDSLVGVLVFGSSKQPQSMNRFIKLFNRMETFIGSEINRKKLEADLYHLYESIPDIVCVADFQGRYLKMNPSGCELLGYSEEELLNHSYEEFVFPADKDISTQEFFKLSQGQSTFSFENRLVQKNGEICWLSWTANVNLQEGLIYATAKNITPEKKLRELNKVSSNMARIGSWEVDLRNNKLFWTEMVHQLHETDPQNFEPDLAQGINFYREDFRNMVTESVAKCIQSGTPFDFEAVLVTANKNELWVRAIGNAEFANGKCIRIYGSFQDIHERKESELRLKSISDNLPGVVFRYIINPDGTDAMRYVSRGAKEIWGYTAEESIKDNNLIWNGIKAGGDFDAVQASILESIKNKSKWTAKWRYMKPSGELRFHIGHGSPEYLTDGTIVFNSMILDSTEEKKNEELLNQASAMARIGSWELDLVNQTGDAMFWSSMTREILGVSDDYNPTLTGGFEFYSEDSKARIRHAVDQLILGGKEFDEELHLTTGQGEGRWIRCIGRGEWARGKCVKIFGSFQDIHQTKSLQLQLSEILGSISDAFYAMDKDWNFTYFNREAENLLKKKAEEVLGNNIWELFPAAIGTSIQEIYERVASTEKPESLEYLYPGDGRWYELNAYPSNGGVSSYFKNIDERKQAAAELEIAFQEKTNILESIGDAFFSVTKDWIVTYWNKEAEHVLGKQREAVLGKNYWEVFPDVAKLPSFTYYHQAIETGEMFSFEEHYPSLNVWFDVSVYPSVDGLSIYFKDITQRKKANEEIAKSEEKRRLIMNGALDAIISIDTNETITFWNSQAGVIFGWEAEEVMGKPLSEIIIPEPSRRYHVEGLKNYLKTGEGKAINVLLELSALRRNGEEFPIELTVIPIKQGGEEFFCAFIRDITQRKNSEKELLNAYLEKNNILESIGDAFFSVTKDWIVTYWNKEAEHVLGKQRDNIVGKNLWEEYADAIDTDFYRQYHKAMDTQTNQNFEEYYPTLDKWFEVSVYPSSSGLSVYFKDVTLRKQADIRLIKANERFEKATEATNDAIWDWDIENKTYLRSKGIEKFFGAASSQTLDEDDFWTDKFHPQDLPNIRQGIESALQNPETKRWEMEYRIFKENGEIGYVLDKGLIIRNKKGKAIRMVGAMTDISDRKKHEEELLKLNDSLKKYAHELELTNEQLEQFAFIASHDLQEPLRMISSFLDQLRRKYGEQLDGRANQYIHFATDGAKRMKQIILDLLEYSRAGKFNESLGKIHLEHLLNDYKSLRKKIIEEKSAVFVLPHLPIVEGYRAPFTQVLHCLMDNALKYTQEGIPPKIELGVEETESEWIFSIQDNGIGIDTIFFDKIFIIFQRLHNRDQYEGTGIGLSIVKKQVESWGGKIWLESTPEEGSTFYFSLPKINQ